MNLIRYNEANFAEKVRMLTAASSLFDKSVEERTREILHDVFLRGDAALLDLTERFNGIRLFPDQMAVTNAELMAASLAADENLRASIEAAAKNIELFAKKSLRRNWSTTNAHGAMVGEKFDPFHRVGIYIPGGTAPLMSTALMTILLAKVAGCPEIVVCTPCGREGELNPALLYAIRFAGATEIYRLGGAQAIAAMGYGTASIKRVQKVFGPGNAYVVAAKRLLFGYVAVDLLPGPSEVLVIADDSAPADWIAADLLAQAEHGSGHERVWCISDSMRVLREVRRELEKQAPKLKRAEYIHRVLEQNACLIQVKNLDHATDLANLLAPEHCQIITRTPARLALRVHTAGAIFLGPYSPTVVGDYVAGPSHTLPTGGAGSSFAGLTVDQFQRRTSVVQYDKAALKKALPHIEMFAGVEGLGAHAASARIRTEQKKTKSTPRNS